MTIDHEDLNLDALEIRALRFQKLNPLHECFDSSTVLALIARLREAEAVIANALRVFEETPDVRQEGIWWPMGQDSEEFKAGARWSDGWWRDRVQGPLSAYKPTTENGEGMNQTTEHEIRRQS